MNKNKKIYVKRALIVFPIVVVLVGTTLIGAFSSGFLGQGNTSKVEQNENSFAGKTVEELVSDEKALKLIDIHENLENYIDKDVTLEGYFIDYDENTSVFGIEVPLGEGQMTMVSLSYDLENEDLLKDIKETDLVKASGVITSFEEVHEDEEQGDHTHTLPKFNVKEIEVIR